MPRIMNPLGLFWMSISLFAVGFGQEPSQKYTKRVPNGIGFLKKRLDLLVKSDLRIMLPVLHDIINFYLDSKNDIDLNLDYGIFLLSVIIKRLYDEKSATIPASIKYSLKHLIDKNEELMSFFKSQVAHDVEPQDKGLKRVLTLYSNESMWVSQLKKFDILHPKKIHMKVVKNFLKKYKNLEVYQKLLENSTPTPRQADFCLRILAEDAINSTLHKCKVPNACVRIVFRGSNVGFALTHRLLMLQFAYFGRHCNYVSQEKDRNLEDRLCKYAFQEATFLSQNGFMFGELVLEQITFCALIGHYEFLKRSWMVQLIRFRTKDGCFSQQLHHLERQKSKDRFTSKEPWHLNKDTYAHLLSGWCEAQVTSGALTTVLLAVKYLLEVFY